MLRPRRIAPVPRGPASEREREPAQEREPERELKPRRKVERRERGKRDPEDERPFLKVRDRERPAARGLDEMTVSVLYQTPLIRENTFDARFSTMGLSVPLSVPIVALSSAGAHLHGELGVGMTFSRLTFGPSAIDFSHIYFYAPFRLRGLLPLTASLTGELIAGCQFKVFEYDSRDTLDGGFHFVDEFVKNIEADVALGLTYRLTPGLRIRGFAGYLFLSAGLEFTL